MGRESSSNPDVLALERVVSARSELKNYLGRRSAELSEEVRHYPTPIAGCDEQLTKLIEQRTRAFDQLHRVIEADPMSSGHADGSSLAILKEILMSPPVFADDDIENAIRSRLRAAISIMNTA